LALFSPILEQYRQRQEVYRLITTELPKLDAPFVFPEYDVLKETGRTSSFGGKLYPSTNIQQVDPRARHLFIPREGFVFCSIDYSAIELVSLAQQIYRIFGHSALRDLLLEGIDPHAYLGAQLAAHLDEIFGASVAGLTEREIYEVFQMMKHGDEEAKEFYSHWRKFAKPTGLGFPGGLGPATFVDYAKATYGVITTEETAQELRELWLKTFPEMQEYFRYITKLSNPMDEFSYTTPLGLVRVGATYCAACNGVALQAPTAEGAKAAVFEIVRACYDPTRQSPMFGKVFPLAFIHDEILLEIERGQEMGLLAEEAAKLWVQVMQKFMPDVPVKAEPALMEKWDKKAESVFDEKGNLTIWQPSPSLS
jgi:DNA polymerase I-like protein with 3'-5' exonuclease and polymerase domains